MPSSHKAPTGAYTPRLTCDCGCGATAKLATHRLSLYEWYLLEPERTSQVLAADTLDPRHVGLRALRAREVHLCLEALRTLQQNLRERERALLGLMN